MKYRNVLVLILIVLAILWRFFTYISFDYIGFIGITEDDTGRITKVSTGSPAGDAGLIEGDKILTIKGMEPNDRPGINQSIEYTIERDSTQLVIPLKSSKLPNEAVTMTRILGVMGILILLIGIVIFYQIGNILSFVFFLYCFTMAIHWGYFPQVVSEYFQNLITSIYRFVSIFLGSLILHFALIFPEGQTLSLKRYYVIYAPGIVGVVLFIATLLNKDLSTIFSFAEFILVTLYALAGGIVLIKTYIKTPKMSRGVIGINVIFWGLLAANLPYIFSEFLPFMDFGGRIGTSPYSLFFILESIAFAIGIRRVSKHQVESAH